MAPIQNILSLDLDFFMHGIAHNRGDSLTDRPNDHGITPWTVDETNEFLDNVLHVPNKAKGCVVSSHHEVYFAWRDAIAKEEIRTPFFICHVDAHSDLGMGLPSWVYLHSDFLENSIDNRAFPIEGNDGLNFGSFMAFALGNRWISEIDFVTSESWSDDIPRYLLSDSSLAACPERLRSPYPLEIELMHAPRFKIEENSYLTSFNEIRKSVGEPAIKLNLLDAISIVNRYEKTQWDYIYLSHSPGYVPESGDILLQEISKRIVST